MTRVVQRNRIDSETGFTLVEVMVAMVIAVTVLGAVFGILMRGQSSFRREPEVADVHQNARFGLDMIARDLTMAGYKTPPATAILWQDGGGITPDEITIIYADPDIPTSEPMKCGVAGGGGGSGPCRTIDRSSTLNIDPETFDPRPAVDTQAYGDGMILFAIEYDDCGDATRGIVPFELTQPPLMTSAGGRPTVQLNHNPGKGASELNLPAGFDYSVHPDCAVVGMFHVIKYRVNPTPPTMNPVLERRDLSTGEPWIPVANNIENLQFQYASAVNEMMDTPFPPQTNDPLTWINRVRVSIFGRSESRDLEGASVGVFSNEDRYVRKTFSTAVSLRNLAFQAAEASGARTYN
jgi:prepilin-type N-terminal cleavage/methylation domain-containing protein